MYFCSNFIRTKYWRVYAVGRLVCIFSYSIDINFSFSIRTKFWRVYAVGHQAGIFCITHVIFSYFIHTKSWRVYAVGRQAGIFSININFSFSLRTKSWRVYAVGRRSGIFCITQSCIFFLLYTYQVLACLCSGTSGRYFLYTLIRYILSKDSNILRTSLYCK